MKFSDIPRMTKSPNYHINVSWVDLPWHIASLKESRRLELEPPFQRSHVWTRDEQIAYVEYGLKGGLSGRNVYLNARRWGTGEPYPLVLVDGLQRITAVLAFINNEIPAFGYLYNQYEDEMSRIEPCFEWYVNDLPTMQMVVDWYLELNSTGRPHTVVELESAKSYRLTLAPIYEYYLKDRYICISRPSSVGTVLTVKGRPYVVKEIDSTWAHLGLVKIHLVPEGEL